MELKKTIKEHFTDEQFKLFEGAVDLCEEQMSWMTPAVMAMTPSGLITGEYSTAPEASFSFILCDSTKLLTITMGIKGDHVADFLKQVWLGGQQFEGEKITPALRVRIANYVVNKYGSDPAVTNSEQLGLETHTCTNITAVMLSCFDEEKIDSVANSCQKIIRARVHPVFVGLLGRIPDENKASFACFLHPMAPYLPLEIQEAL